MEPHGNLTLSDAERWVQLVVFYAIFGGVASLIGNLAIAVAILSHKTFRTRFFIIIWFLVMIRACLSFGYIVVFMYRILRLLDIVETNITRLTCLIIQCHFIYIQTIEMVHLLILVVDKILAIAAFQYYRNLTYRHAVITCSIATVIMLILKIVPSLFDVDFFQIIPCVSGFAPVTRIYNAYTTNLELSLALLILLLYIILIVHVYIRRSRLAIEQERANGDRSGLIAFKRHSKLLPLLQRLVLMHCGTTLLQKIFGLVLLHVPSRIWPRLATYVGMLVTLEMFCNVIILLVSDQNLREASFPFCAKLGREHSVTGSRGAARNAQEMRRNR